MGEQFALVANLVHVCMVLFMVLSVGGAYSFDGIDDYIEIVLPENISFVDSFQVSMRVQIVDNPVDRYRYSYTYMKFRLSQSTGFTCYSLANHLKS